MELGVFASPPAFLEPPTLGPWTSLTVGWGFDAGPVHLRTAAHVGAAWDLVSRDALGSRFSSTPVALSLAASNLVDDEQHSGLRLSPALGVTIPTQFGSEIAWSTLSATLQLERRFGPVELAWRAESGKPFFPPAPMCLQQPRLCEVTRNPINWTLENSLQAEGWIDPSVSVGLRLGFAVAWNHLLPGAQGVPAQTVADTRLSTSGRAWVSWALLRLLGLSLDLTSVQSLRRADGRVRFPFFSFDSLNEVTVSLSVWFRSDFTLARNWIER